MIFSVQRYLEDYFHHRNLADVDQYAVKLANLYARERNTGEDEELLKSMRRIKTAFYKTNSQLDRPSEERGILRRLDQRFKKKANPDNEFEFPGGVAAERAKLAKLSRRSIQHLLEGFKHGIEARAVDVIWESRVKGRLRPKSEKVAQGLLAAFIMGTLSDGTGHLLREISSGVGFVDVGIMLGSALHLMELKILRGGNFPGVSQLTQYMRTEQRPRGWLVVFDARDPENQKATPKENPHEGRHNPCISDQRESSGTE